MNTPSPVVPSAPVAGRISPEKRYITPAAVDILQSTYPWVMMFALLGFLCAAFCGMGALMMLAMSIGMSFADVGDAEVPAGIFLLFPPLYLAAGTLYFFGSRHLYRYATRIRALRDNPGSIQLEDALAAQRSFWKLAGISVIVMMVLYGLLIVGMVAASFLLVAF